MIRRLSVVGALFAVAFASQSATAAPGGDSVLVSKIPVAYGDLDVRSQAGQAVLATRIASAASMACGGNPVFHAHYQDAQRFVRADFERCRANAQTGAFIALQQRGIRLAYNR